LGISIVIDITIFAKVLEFYNSAAFPDCKTNYSVTHTLMLDQAFAYCQRFFTAAIRVDLNFSSTEAFTPLREAKHRRLGVLSPLQLPNTALAHPITTFVS